MPQGQSTKKAGRSDAGCYMYFIFYFIVSQSLEIQIRINICMLWLISSRLYRYWKHTYEGVSKSIDMAHTKELFKNRILEFLQYIKIQNHLSMKLGPETATWNSYQRTSITWKSYDVQKQENVYDVRAAAMTSDSTRTYTYMKRLRSASWVQQHKSPTQTRA